MLCRSHEYSLECKYRHELNNYPQKHLRHLACQEILEERLDQRKTETEESKKKRLKKAKLEMTYARRFDHVILNKDLEKAKKEAEEILREFLTE